MRTLIVVVSYNDVKNTVKTVESLMGQGDIVVWDNGSSDGTVSELRSRFDDQIIVHANTENFLWSPAINIAVDLYLDGQETILMSNNDIIYYHNTIERLQASVEEGVGVTAPIGSGVGGMQDFAHWYGKGNRIKHPVDFVKKLPPLRVACVVGASMMIPTTVWNELGPLDEKMPLGADDHDYCIRAKDAGYGIYVQQSAYITHKAHSSFRHSKQNWDDWGGRSWEVFNKKWAGYFATEQEAIKCHWGYAYNENWEIGTGWLPDEERAAIWATRNQEA